MATQLSGSVCILELTVELILFFPLFPKIMTAHSVLDRSTRLAFPFNCALTDQVATVQS